MEIPFFYTSVYDGSSPVLQLDEDNSKHIVQVLRMKNGQNIHITDGRGNLLTCEITDAHKKHCKVSVREKKYIAPDPRKITIGISLLKNAARFEWFLEKAAEIGINEVVPLICVRTEKEKFRSERMKQICISAMLQSRQTHLMNLRDPLPVKEMVSFPDHQQKFIAHCMDEDKRQLMDLVNESLSSQIILIGPEGDFTKEETERAVASHFIPVSLGETRLRTETAGIVAAVILKNHSDS
jgi:16S rRNA (uracil1498-N3)-methyltransferase